MHRLELSDLAATERFARRLARAVRKGDLVFLRGDLGAGKSTLARFVIRELVGAEIEVPSPTFTLIQSYEAPSMSVTHADLYRLADPHEVLELGLDEAQGEGCVLVEWPERASDLLPPATLDLTLAHETGAAEHTRSLSIATAQGYEARFSPLLAD